MHPSQTFTIMVQVHINCQKDHLCHQLCLQRASFEDELKYLISAQLTELTVIQLKVMRIVHLTVFLTLTSGFTGMVTCIIQI
jgi:hypothetical protein